MIKSGLGVSIGCGGWAGILFRAARPFSKILALTAVLAAFLFLPTGNAWAEESAGTVLRAYGPGGPHHVIGECAELFKLRYGIAVGVIRASPLELAKRLKEDGDIFFTGAEYMLEEFVEEYSDIIDPATAVKLHPRQVGIVVREGNPHGIMGVECLGKDGVVLMAANLEEMGPFLSPDGTGRAKVALRAQTGFEGMKAWRANSEIDAWLTYRSWHRELKDGSVFIEIPWAEARRHTMAAVTEGTDKREEALKFIEFLKSSEAREIFLKHGWD